MLDGIKYEMQNKIFKPEKLKVNIISSKLDLFLKSFSNRDIFQINVSFYTVLIET